MTSIGQIRRARNLGILIVPATLHSGYGEKRVEPVKPVMPVQNNMGFNPSKIRYFRGTEDGKFEAVC